MEPQGGVAGWRAWLMAIRPRTLPAAVAPVVAGTGIAAGLGVADPAPAVAALLGALLLQVATNLANDYFDFAKGSDTEARVGPTRVVQAGILSPRSVLRATWGVLALATLVGGYLVWVGGWPILVVGLLALLCAVIYTGGPFPLAYHGLGDVFVFLFFGPVAVAGTYWVQARTFHWDLLVAGAGMGALVTAILVVNNLRDRETDMAAGKRTLAVRLGEMGTRVQYLLLVLLALACPVVGVAAWGWHPWVLVTLATVIPVARPLGTVFTYMDPRELNPVLGQTARAVTWYGALLAAGFVAGGMAGPEAVPDLRVPL
ncbi:MAG: 1,4-dihydroxy-2-naphthoate polyprenyltransferase [Gemmatimonadales bacterium]|nr:MAG: 1,4-dihydroxy-2-naphthoate polyprenyltransferase [Gemmatimonadales bacterium]